jgi:hypothetical protein
MIPLSMLSRRVVWSSCLTMFFTFGNMMTTTYYLAIYFQAVKGDSPTMSGVSTLPTILSTMMMAIGSGVLGKSFYVCPNLSPLTTSSRQSRLLSAFLSRCRCWSGHQLWSAQHTVSYELNWDVDRLSNHRWIYTWWRHADGELCPPTTYQLIPQLILRQTAHHRHSKQPPTRPSRRSHVSSRLLSKLRRRLIPLRRSNSLLKQPQQQPTQVCP